MLTNLPLALVSFLSVVELIVNPSPDSKKPRWVAGLFDDGVGAEEAAQGRPMGSNKKDRREPVFFVIVSPPGWAMFA